MQPCTPPPQSLEYASLLCDSCQSLDHNTNSCPRAVFMISRLKQLKHEMKTYREFMENMACIVIDQFSESVKTHVKSTMPILHEINLRAGPSTPEACLLGDFESSCPFSLYFQADTYLSDFEGKKDISSPFLACASPITTSSSMDTLDYVLNSLDLSIPLVLMEEPK